MDNTTNYNVSGITYDQNGNILTLQRQGHTNAGATLFGIMDKLGYSYDSGNKLLRVSDTGNDAYGFKDGSNTGDDYEYDQNGNLTQDLNKSIAAGGIQYNYLNMPTKVTVTGANAGVLDYVYSADGIKLQKIKTQGGSTTTTDYIGDYVYENNVLKQISHPEGYIEPDGSGWQYVYYLKDHQNNVRITFADDNNNGSVNSSEIRKERNFYPFGLEHRGYNSNSYGVENNLKTFQDQEFTEDLGLNTHEWKYRVSDPTTGRFWQVDPLATDYTHNSPYAFSENRVINGVELEGLEYATYGYNETGANANVQATAMRSTRTETEKAQEASSTLDLTPFVGDAKGFVETFTGTDLVTGESLGWGPRLLGLVFLSEFRVVDDVVDASKTVTKNIDEVKAIGPVGDAGGDVMKQLPENMQSNAKTTKNKGGTIYKDPDNPAGNNVRVQNGNPNSPNPAQQKPYVKQVKDGKTVDVNGNQANPKSTEAHIPKEKFKYN